MALNRLASLTVDVLVNSRRAIVQLQTFQRSLQQGFSPLATLGLGIGAAGLAAGGFLVLQKSIEAVGNTIKEVVERFAEFEKQIVTIEAIAKTGQINKLADEFFNLGETVAFAEFDNIAETFAEAARAGVRLESGLVDLTKAALILKETSGDISSQEAALGLAALKDNLNFTGDIMDLASGIDALSDSLLVTSGEILVSSARLAGFAESFDVTVEELTGLTAALLSTRASATTVRTTITQLFTALESSPLKVAKNLKLSAQETEHFFQLLESSLIDATKFFIQGFQNLDPSEQTEALLDLGLASARTSQVIRLFGGNLDKIDESIALATAETHKGTAALEKHAKLFDTTSAKLNVLNNQWQVYKATLFETGGVVDMVIGAFEALKAVTESLNLGGAGKFEVGIPNFDSITGLDLEIKQIQDRLAALRGNQQDIIEGTGFNLGSGIGNLFLIPRMLADMGEAKKLQAQLNVLEEAGITLLGKQVYLSQLQGMEYQRQIDLHKILNKARETIGKPFTQDIQDKLKLKIAFDPAEIDNLIRQIEELPFGPLMEAQIKEALNAIKAAPKEQTEEERIAAEERLKKASEEQLGELQENIDKFSKIFQTPLDKEIGGFIDDLNAIKMEMDAFIGPADIAANLEAQFEALQFATKDLIKTKIEEAAAEEAKKVAEANQKKIETLTDIAGEFGKIVTTVQKFDEILNQDFVKNNAELFDAIQIAAEKELEGIFEPTKVKRTMEFKGLTEAWKDAQISVKKKEDAQREEQLRIAKEALRQVQVSNKHLKDIADKELTIQ